MVVLPVRTDYSAAQHSTAEPLNCSSPIGKIAKTQTRSEVMIFTAAELGFSLADFFNVHVVKLVSHGFYRAVRLQTATVRNTTYERRRSC